MAYSIPLFELNYDEQEERAVLEVLRSRWISMGPKTAELEAAFAAHTGSRHAIAVSNATAALHLALAALGVGPGDEVIVPSLTFVATVNAVGYVGATPVFADIVGRDDFSLDPEHVKRLLTPCTKAIIPIHLYGQPAAMDVINEIAAHHNLAVVEDAAQAHGASFKGKNVGTLGRLACFSFYPGKNLGAYGDAGAIATNDEALANKVRMLSNHGRLKKYEHEIEGYNSRLDTLQAAVLSVKLRHLRAWTEKRQQNASTYSQLLARAITIVTPVIHPGATHVFHLYVVRVQQREKVQQALKEAGIATGIHYPIPLHLQPAYKHLGLPTGSYPVAERFASEILSLPMYPELTNDQIAFICDTLIKACQSSTASKPV